MVDIRATEDVSFHYGDTKPVIAVREMQLISWYYVRPLTFVLLQRFD